MYELCVYHIILIVVVVVVAFTKLFFALRSLFKESRSRYDLGISFLDYQNPQIVIALLKNEIVVFDLSTLPAPRYGILLFM